MFEGRRISRQNETIKHDKSRNTGGDKKDEVARQKSQGDKEIDTDFWMSRDKTKRQEYVLSRPSKKPGGAEALGGAVNLGLGNQAYEGQNWGLLFLLV